MLIEIVEINDQSNTLPIVTPESVRETLTRIRAKNMVKGVTKMTEIYKDLDRLENEIDEEIMEATLSHTIPSNQNLVALKQGINKLTYIIQLPNLIFSEINLLV